MGPRIAQTHPPVSSCLASSLPLEAEPAMEDAASEIGDWEVLSAASAPGGDDDVVLVSGEGSDVLHDHFALVLSDAGFSAEASWSGAASDDEGKEADLELTDRLDWISEERLDLVVEDSSVKSQVGGADGTAESSVLDATVAGGAAWGAEERQVEATEAEIEQEKHAAHGRGEFDLILQPLHHAVVESLDSDPTMVADGPQSEALANSDVQLEDGGVDVTRGSSVLEDIATGGGMQSAQEDQEHGENASATSGCGESDGEVKDGSLPLVQTPGTGEGERQVVVLWRLPFRLVQYCAWKVKPVWWISIATTFLGLVVLGRRMYRMRRKTWGLPQIKIAFDDTRASQFADRAARLNEAFLIARRVPALGTSSGAVLPWSMVQER